MQNTYVQRAELRFWKILTPLMHRSPLVKVFLRFIHTSLLVVKNFLDEVLDGTLQNTFLFVSVFLGGCAFGIGYLIAVLFF